MSLRNAEESEECHLFGGKIGKNRMKLTNVGQMMRDCESKAELWRFDATSYGEALSL